MASSFENSPTCLVTSFCRRFCCPEDELSYIWVRYLCSSKSRKTHWDMANISQYFQQWFQWILTFANKKSSIKSSSCCNIRCITGTFTGRLHASSQRRITICPPPPPQPPTSCDPKGWWSLSMETTAYPLDHLLPTSFKWMFGETTISYRKNWNHPVETTIYKQMFQLPGKHQPTKTTTTFFQAFGAWQCDFG